MGKNKNRKLDSVKTGVREMKEIIEDFLADLSIEKVKRKRNTNKEIKVGFVVQVPEIWDKEEPVYEAMINHNSFEPELIVVPPYNQISQTVETNYDDNYFLSKYPDAIRAFGNGGWTNIDKRKYDYMFLQRPYDMYLPKGFRSSDLVKQTKVCYIPYGFSGSNVFDRGNTNKEFFRNTYFAFLESDHMVRLLKSQYFLPHRKKLHRIQNLGYPALLPYLSFPEIHEIKRITWTPRWSFDSVAGGSNFLKYKDTILTLAKEYKDCKFVIRPHPLMLGEIIKKEILSEKEVDDYVDSLEKANITLDLNTPLEETLRNTDLLITDYSSIIIHFFLTRRPIIYCESGIVFNDEYNALKQAMYVVESESELIQSVEKIVDGIDPLKAQRDTISRKQLTLHRDSVKNILKSIEEDYTHDKQTC